MLSKECLVGGNLTFFLTSLTKYEKVSCFLLQKLREFFCGIFYTFSASGD